MIRSWLTRPFRHWLGNPPTNLVAMGGRVAGAPSDPMDYRVGGQPPRSERMFTTIVAAIAADSIASILKKFMGGTIKSLTRDAVSELVREQLAAQAPAHAISPPATTFPAALDQVYAVLSRNPRFVVAPDQTISPSVHEPLELTYDARVAITRREVASLRRRIAAGERRRLLEQESTP